MKRRDFFKSGTRAVILAGLGGAVAWLTFSGKVKENSVCPPSGDCRSCSKLSGCNKSQVTKTDGYGK